MTKRRGHGEGTIRQRADGSWEARVSLPSGKRPSIYGRTRKEVQDKLRAALRAVDAGLDLDAGKTTVGDFLDRWLADVVKPKAAPKTYSSYAEIVRVHIKPTVGNHTLAKLTPAHVAAMLQTKRDAGLS